MEASQAARPPDCALNGVPPSWALRTDGGEAPVSAPLAQTVTRERAVRAQAMAAGGVALRMEPSLRARPVRAPLDLGPGHWTLVPCGQSPSGTLATCPPARARVCPRR